MAVEPWVGVEDDAHGSLEIGHVPNFAPEHLDRSLRRIPFWWGVTDLRRIEKLRHRIQTRVVWGVLVFWGHLEASATNSTCAMDYMGTSILLDLGCCPQPLQNTRHPGIAVGTTR